ncbi:MAG: CehA/McbA family metallohydrolase [Verrucomicrobia bacterium]|nr:CehA/McbA family metallohydrolase [Verrucomicrobiota bacterium]MDA1068181.1 CehA/McbA family metallohydrolase [Verrucomicrobiota bacterium]
MGSTKFKFFLPFIFPFVIVLSGCSSKQWYKGNTHTHTVLCGHADSTPEVVTKWYHDRGYNFLCLSEHNIFIDPADVPMPAGKRDDFILIPGEEITGGGHAHTTALNTAGLVDPSLQKADGASKTEVIQAHVHGTLQQHGHAILNHPNFNYMNTAEDIRPVKGLHMFELHNGHPKVHNFGDAEHISVEAMWDQLLTDGMLIYGVSSDDAHSFQKLAPDESNPGRGWVMVRSESLTPDAITDAMLHGDFYATSGVMLSELESTTSKINLKVDEQATEAELQSTYIIGHFVENGKAGYTIQFIGDGGKLLQQIDGSNASYAVTKESSYVRAKVTLTKERDGRLENFYAWTQPVFTDGRGYTLP